MEMEAAVIRDARPEDAGRIREIYAYYVENTAITFEYEVPTLTEMQARIENTLRRYPYLVAEVGGTIQGYAYAGAFIGRAAYDWSCQLSVYLDRDARKCGLGGMLYRAMEERLKSMGITNLYACVAVPDEEDGYLSRNSADFHAHLGFSAAGEFHKCGNKFGRWYNMLWMEKIIGTHGECQPPVMFGGLGQCIGGNAAL